MDKLAICDDRSETIAFQGTATDRSAIALKWNVDGLPSQRPTR